MGENTQRNHKGKPGKGYQKPGNQFGKLESVNGKEYPKGTIKGNWGKVIKNSEIDLVNWNQ